VTRLRCTLFNKKNLFWITVAWYRHRFETISFKYGISLLTAFLATFSILSDIRVVNFIILGSMQILIDFDFWSVAEWMKLDRNG
jgi:hypothetical protein